MMLGLNLSLMTQMRGGAGDPYTINGFAPAFVADYANSLFRNGETETDTFPTVAGFTHTVGTVAIAFTTQASAFSARQVLLSSANEAVANKWLEIGLTDEGKVYIEYNNGGTIQTVVGQTYLSTSTKYLIFVAHDGNDYYAQVGSTEQNPLMIESVGTFGWFSDIDGTKNLHAAKTVTSGGDGRVFGGTMHGILIWNEDITQ